MDKNITEESKAEILEKDATIQEILQHKNYDRQKWTQDAIHKLMPVARRWAAERMCKGEDFGSMEDEIMDVHCIEVRLYEQMKATFLHHVRIHGYSADVAHFVQDIKTMPYFCRNQYRKLLSEMRKAYVEESENSSSLEYLISKTNEFLKKVKDIGETAYQMLQEGQQPDLGSWSEKMQSQDAVFEENKQFLKQTLKHFATMKANHVKFGTAEIRLLLYQRDGCRREKHYHRAETWIIDIYNSLPCSTEEEKAEQTQIYKEICAFVYEMVPTMGYFSVHMINFIFDRGFLSTISRDLLLRMCSRVKAWGMLPLFHRPLKSMMEKVYANFCEGSFSTSDFCVLDVAEAYEPELIPNNVLQTYNCYKESKKAEEQTA